MDVIGEVGDIFQGELIFQELSIHVSVNTGEKVSFQSTSWSEWGNISFHVMQNTCVKVKMFHFYFLLQPVK